MPLIPAKCTQCGANIKVDDSKDAGICEYCGTAFITEKAINNYNTYITNNYEGANINIISQDNPDYMCPKCRSGDTKALKVLKKGRPTYDSLENQFNTLLVISFLFVAFGISSVIAKSSSIAAGLISLGGAALFALMAYDSRKKGKENYKEYREAYSTWLNSYQCMRCGKIFVVEDKPEK